MGKELMCNSPKTIIIDGLPAYHDVYKKEFWALKTPRTKHINTIRIRGDKNNNKMERFNGEIKDHEKVMSGLKKKDTPLPKGYQILHNYIRPHEATKGRTPAEACGVEVKGENKWMTIIQNARNQTKSNIPTNQTKR